MELSVTEVFTPTSFPIHTYVERKSAGLEDALRNAFASRGRIASLSGPSKSGKTVLIEKVVGDDNLVIVAGGGLKSAEAVWDSALDFMKIPHTTSTNRNSSTTSGTKAGFKGRAGLPGVITGEGAAEFSIENAHGSDESHTHVRAGFSQVIDRLKDSQKVLLIDDFHYVPHNVQVDIAEMIKEAAHQHVKICIAAVPHRGDDVLRANSDLRGRVHTIELKYWNNIELQQIARSGFSALNINVPNEVIEVFASEAAGSPQLMQEICLNACHSSGIKEKRSRIYNFPKDQAKINHILEQTTVTADSRTLVDILISGPKTRGTTRTNFTFQDGTAGDVYTTILKAVMTNPPSLSFSYEELTRRVAKVCYKKQPVGSSIIGACQQMSELAKEKFPKERAIDWDHQKQILDISDPYLLFYLRWSKKLKSR